MPLNEVNICPEYISSRNFDKKHQVVLLEIGDDTGKWHFLALPSNLDEDGIRRPKRVYQDYWKVYHQKVMMIFIAMVAYILFAVKQH